MNIASCGQFGESFIYTYYPITLTEEQMQEIHDLLNSGEMTKGYLDNLFGEGKYDWVKTEPVEIRG